MSSLLRFFEDLSPEFFLDCGEVVGLVDEIVLAIRLIGLFSSSTRHIADRTSRAGIGFKSSQTVHKETHRAF